MASCIVSAQAVASAAQRSLRPKQAARPAGALAAAARVVRPSSARRAAVRVQAQAAATTTTADVKQLNAQFGKAGAVEVKAGRGDLPTVVLTDKSGASAEVALFGAAVLSWKTSDGSEVLYIRPDAVFDKSKPISGGIPHCFPQFGPGAMQLHGFARNVDWELAGTSSDAGGPSVQLVLRESEYTKAMWPTKFEVTYTVKLAGGQLHTSMSVRNTDAKAFNFTGSLHSYFGVADIEQAAVRGLQGLEYLDRVADAKHPTVHKELREAVTFSGPMDSVYRAAKPGVTLDTGAGTVTITNTNWKDVVVWTPWTAMDCYRSFVCVENAQFDAVTVQPGESWSATTVMSYSVDPLAQFCGDNPDADECRVYDD